MLFPFSFWKSGYSTKAQKVIDRMSNLTKAEKDSIAKFVDTLDGRGDWDVLEEVYCYALNETDSLTGWVSRTGSIDNPGNWNHSNTRGWATTSTSQVNPIRTGFTPTQIWDATDHFGAIGVWVTDYSYTGTSNWDIFGVNDSGIEFYTRYRGSDTEDFNILAMGDSRTSRPKILLPDLHDKMLTIGRGPVEEQFMKDGGTDIMRQTSTFEGVPTLECFVCGRNNAGTASFSRESGFAFFYVLNGDFTSGATAWDDFYSDVRTLLTDLGVTNVP